MSTETGAQRARHTRGDYADGLIRWQLHDCSGVQEALLRHKMCAWFARWQRLRSKGVTETRTVTKRSLDQAWTAFIDRWNAETGSCFRQLTEAHEGTHERLALGALATSVYDLSWSAERTCCYVYLLEGCDGCRGYNLTRPYEDEWRRFLGKNPLSSDE
ncbi:hypothetical protein PI124_g10838 [Phytophthora idaei]|nr:hypothetical protein PI125_g10408 [Phytophthora idaei]KAG3152788.1 hypothetical protein PI126_g10362 [Phytophthora idaei]KAG3244384.1 hypothetical protein PI124_g10838 [Phytophthora idaei]